MTLVTLVGTEASGGTGGRTNTSITGTLLSCFTGTGVESLTVEARDEEEQIQEPIGVAKADAKGFFEIPLDHRFQDEITP